MYHEMKALLEAKTRAGEDGQNLVDGALRAIHEFVTISANVPLPIEFRRLAAILTGPHKGMDMVAAFDDTLRLSSDDLRNRPPATEQLQKEEIVATNPTEPEVMTIELGDKPYLRGGQYYTPDMIKGAIEALKRELPEEVAEAVFEISLFPDRTRVHSKGSGQPQTMISRAIRALQDEFRSASKCPVHAPVAWLDTADATKWADAFLSITHAPTFEVPNLWDHNFLTGWFANAIEAGRRHKAPEIAALLKAGSEWCLEMIFDARGAHEDGTPKMGKFETEQVFRAFKAALNDRFRP